MLEFLTEPRSLRDPAPVTSAVSGEVVLGHRIAQWKFDEVLYKMVMNIAEEESGPHQTVPRNVWVFWVS